MQIHTKLLNWPGKGDQVLIIALIITRGVLDARGVGQILNEVASVVVRHPNCTALIDLIDADCKVDLKKIDRLFHESQPDLWPRQCKTALVSSLDHDQYSQLALLRKSLVDLGFRIAVFRDTKAAVDWLADGT